MSRTCAIELPRDAAPDREEALAAALRAGDPAAFDELHRRYLTMVHGYVARRVPVPQDAEDVTCDVFVAAVQAAGKYRGTSGLKPWLLGIARRKVIDWLRREGRRAKVFDPEPFEAEERLVCEDLTPDKYVEQDELSRSVRSAVQGLPANEREALLLHTCEELDLVSIGAVMGRTGNAVKCLLRRARNRMRERLEPLLEPPAGRDA